MSADGAAALEFVSNEVIQLLATARQVTMADPEEDGELAGDGEVEGSPARAWQTIVARILRSFTDLEPTDVDVDDVVDACVEETISEVADRFQDYKEVLIDELLRLGYLKHINEPSEFAVVQDKAISESTRHKMILATEKRAEVDRNTLKKAIEIYQLFARLRELSMQVGGLRANQFVMSFDEILRGSIRMDARPNIHQVAFRAVSTSISETELTQDLKLFVLAVLSSARTDSEGGLSEIIHILEKAVDRAVSSAYSPDEYFTRDQVVKLKNFFFGSSSIQTGLYEAMTWIVAVEGTDEIKERLGLFSSEVGLSGTDDISRTQSIRPGRAADDAGAASRKPDLEGTREVEIWDDRLQRPVTIRYLRRAVDATLMSIASRGYYDGADPSTLRLGHEWYARHFLGFLASIARNSFFTGTEGAAVLSNLDPEVARQSLLGNLGETLRTTGSLGGHGAAIIVRGHNGLDLSATTGPAPGIFDFSMYAHFLTRVTSTQDAALIDFLDRVKERIGSGGGAVTFSYPDEDGGVTPYEFNPSEFGLSWSSTPRDLAHAIESWMQDEGIFQMHGQGRWVFGPKTFLENGIQVTRMMWMFQTAIIPANLATIDQLTGLTGMDPTTGILPRLYDLDEFSSMPTRLRILNGESLVRTQNNQRVAITLESILDGTYIPNSGTTHFATQENRVMQNSLISEVTDAYQPGNTRFRIGSSRISEYLTRYSGMLGLWGITPSTSSSPSRLAIEQLQRRLRIEGFELSTAPSSTITEDQVDGVISGSMIFKMNELAKKRSVLGSESGSVTPPVKIYYWAEPRATDALTGRQRLVVGVELRSDDARLNPEFRGFTLFVSDDHEELYAQITDIVQDITGWFDRVATSLDTSDLTSRPVSTTGAAREADINSNNGVPTYFQIALEALINSPATASRFSWWSGVRNVEWSSSDDTCTMIYQYGSDDAMLLLEAVVNWRTGMTIITDLASNEIIASGIGISPDPLVRASRVQAQLLSVQSSATNVESEDEDSELYECRIVQHAPRVGDPASFPDAIPSLHPVGGDGGVFWIDVVAGVAGTEISEWNRIATFRISIPTSGSSQNMAVEQWYIDDDGAWVPGENIRAVPDTFATLVRRVAQLYTSAASRGWSLIDVSNGESGDGNILCLFDVYDENGNKIGRIERHESGRFYTTVSGLTNDAWIGSREIDLSTFPNGKRFGYTTSITAINALAQTRQFFADLQSQGILIVGNPSIVEVSNYPRVYIRTVLPADLSITQENVNMNFEPVTASTNILLGNRFTTPIRGGVVALIQMIRAFQTTYGMPGGGWSLVVGNHMNLCLEFSADGFDFGSGVEFDEAIDATARFDLSATSRNFVLDSTDLVILALELNGYMFGTTPIDIAARYFTQERLINTVGVLNRIAAQDLLVSEIRGPVEMFGLDDDISFRIVLTDGNTISMRVVLIDGEYRILVGRSWMATWNMLADEDEDRSALTRMRTLFECYLDGTYNRDEGNLLGVRLEEWLVHHFLGVSYSDISHMYGYYRADYRALVRQACTIAGINVDGDWSEESYENDLNILNWFLLYVNQAGNNHQSSLQSWVANNVDIEILGMSRDEFRALGAEDFAIFLGNHQAFVWIWMASFGLDDGPGGGFVSPP